MLQNTRIDRDNNLRFLELEQSPEQVLLTSLKLE